MGVVRVNSIHPATIANAVKQAILYPKVNTDERRVRMDEAPYPAHVLRFVGRADVGMHEPTMWCESEHQQVMLGSGLVIRVYQGCREEYREEYGSRDGKAVAPSSCVGHGGNLPFYTGIC